MKENEKEILIEIRELMRLLLDESRQLKLEVSELKDEQRKMHEELKLSNFVLHNIGIRSEILN